VALRATLRHRRFGNTYFELYSLPFSPGGRLAGRIHLKLDADAAHGIDLRLSCVRRTITGSGNNRSHSGNRSLANRSERAVWSHRDGSARRTIPVDFEIPPDAYVTDHDNTSDQVLWLLHAKADVPGIDYADDFELPVFRTSSAAELSPAASSSGTPGFSSESCSVTDSAPVAAPAHTRVVISSQAGGTEFYFPAFRTPSRALFLLVFAAIWSGVVYFLFHSVLPGFLAWYSDFDFLMILICFHVVLGTSRIRVGNGEIISTTESWASGLRSDSPFLKSMPLFRLRAGSRAAMAETPCTLFACAQKTDAGLR
jgi:hypothetical protein